jgi:23S rRNA (pseudouridine1915-N3)-methyltransferase
MIKIIAGGKKNKGWIQEVCEEYEKRLKRPFDVEWNFVNEEKLSEKVLDLSKDKVVILLDENGVMMDSIKFASTIDNCFTNSKDVVFVIGGAFGHFPAELKKRADIILSLSKMVFPHQICRLILVEQLYRAQEIRRDSKYHHA